MARSKKNAQSVAEYVAALVKRRALRAIGEHDEALSKVYDKIAEGIRRDLRATGFTIKEVRDVLDKHFGATRAERIALVERAIRDAAREARDLDTETFDAVFGGEEDAVQKRPLDRPSKQPGVLYALPRNESEDKPPSTD